MAWRGIGDHAVDNDDPDESGAAARLDAADAPEG
jgi:hypothetical protein